MNRQVMAAIVFYLVAATMAMAATVKFVPSTADITNPERGFWLTPSLDFSTVTDSDLVYPVSQSVSLIYAPIRLDQYRMDFIPQSKLDDLNDAFAAVRRAGLKVILRAAYNNPQPGDVMPVPDAPLKWVLRHIEQLRPVIAANADVIAVWQAGFIGLWGEGHGSTNGLESPAAKQRIRDALLKVLPSGRTLQWRRPDDLISWINQPDGMSKFSRIGIFNDCFLASPTDVGTYSTDPVVRAKQRQVVATRSSTTWFGGETCFTGGQERLSCADILSEGRQFHLITLKRDDESNFYESWEKGRCLNTVRRSLGYRLVLLELAVPDGVVRGRSFAVSLSLRNDGWARPINPRKIVVEFVHVGSGQTYNVLTADARTLRPEAKTVVLRGTASLPSNAPSGTYRIQIGAPDSAATLAGNAHYAIRFANVQQGGQKWNGATGRFESGRTFQLAP